MSLSNAASSRFILTFSAVTLDLLQWSQTSSNTVWTQNLPFPRTCEASSMVPPCWCSLINTNDVNEDNLSFVTYFTVLFFFFLLPDLQRSGHLQLMAGPHGWRPTWNQWTPIPILSCCCCICKLTLTLNFKLTLTLPHYQFYFAEPTKHNQREQLSSEGHSSPSIQISSLFMAGNEMSGKRTEICPRTVTDAQATSASFHLFIYFFLTLKRLSFSPKCKIKTASILLANIWIT